MALTLESAAETEADISLKDFIDYCDDKIDPCDLDSAIKNAHIFTEFSTNRKAIMEIIHRDIENYLLGKSVRMYSSQSLVLHSNQRFILRMNLWSTLSSDERRSQLESKLYSYDRAHDHNFSFLTAGTGGPGYKTSIFEYDRSKIKGYVGEGVDMTFSEETTLPKGKVMFYRSGRDIHDQFPPEKNSTSLNLMLQDPHEVKYPQYFFNLDKKTVDGVVASRVGKRTRFFEIVSVLGDENTKDRLVWFKEKHECAKTQTAAMAAIQAIEERV